MKQSDYYINWITESEPILANYFIQVLENIKSDVPFMIELGCAEAVYSRVFNDFFGGKCKNICTDILPRQIEVGKTHCPNAEFIHGYAGKPMHIQEIAEDNFGAKRIYLDALIGDKKLDLLHMDIQGSEIYVMEEIKNNGYIKNINYLFISLHNTYDQVKEYITKDFEYLYENPTEGGLGDGLIIIKNKKFFN